MKKNVQRINESQLRAIVAESVKKVLRESYNPMDDEEAYQFMNWAANSSSDIMQNIYGYYQSCRERNQNDANWYMEKILFAYANKKGCEESELNTNAIEKAINEWGYYNYEDSLNESNNLEVQNKRKIIIQKRIKTIKTDLAFLERVFQQCELDNNGIPVFDEPRNSWQNTLNKVQEDFRLLLIGCGMSPKDV